MLKGMIASATSIISLRKVAAIEGGIGPRTLLGNDFAMGRLAGAAGFEPANAGTKNPCPPYEQPTENRRNLRVMRS